VGYKLAEGKGLREGWDSKELWKSENRNPGKGRLRYTVAHGEDNQVGVPPEVLKSA